MGFTVWFFGVMFVGYIIAMFGEEIADLWRRLRGW